MCAPSCALQVVVPLPTAAGAGAAAPLVQTDRLVRRMALRLSALLLKEVNEKTTCVVAFTLVL